MIDWAQLARYGLHGDLEEVEQWEWVPGQLRLVPRLPSSNNNPSSGSGLINIVTLDGFVSTSVRYLGSNATSGSGSLTAFFLGEVAADEVDWGDFVGFDLAAGEASGPAAPAPVPSAAAAGPGQALVAMGPSSGFASSYWASFQSAAASSGGLPLPEYAAAYAASGAPLPPVHLKAAHKAADASPPSKVSKVS